MSMLIRIDPEGPRNSTPAVLKAYQKNMRRKAKKELVAREVQLKKANMTQEEFEGRVGALKASEFAKSVLSRAKAALAGADIAAIDDDDDDDDEEDAGVQEQHDELEVDLEDEAAREGADKITLSVDQHESLFVQQGEPDESP
ncbi:hypothetical protein IWX49DRAFT_50620 [Phyllosticta citricarpa]|uniref:Uncharacterized protein n=2 Tax=Phyllosticta TaxID=121621 RepID=A0ABR1LBP6_9PEZI